MATDGLLIENTIFVFSLPRSSHISHNRRSRCTVNRSDFLKDHYVLGLTGRPFECVEELVLTGVLQNLV